MVEKLQQVVVLNRIQGCLCAQMMANTVRFVALGELVTLTFNGVEITAESEAGLSGCGRRQHVIESEKGGSLVDTSDGMQILRKRPQGYKEGYKWRQTV